jgi:hypothetical protein
MEATEQAQNPEVAAQAVETHEKKSPQESFAELRRAKDDAERQAWQAKKELELMQQQHQRMQQPQPQEEEFDFKQLEQEEFPDGKKLVKAFSQVNKKISSYEQKMSEKEAKIQALEFAVEHPDFKDIVTPENIEKYIKNDEDNREAVEKSSNPLRKVYNLLKKEIARTPKEKPISQEQKKVDEKEMKPKTTSAGVRSEAVTVAAKMTNSTMSKEQRNAIWKETQQYARR